MYLAVILLTMLVLPLVSLAAEFALSGGPLLAPAMTWFVFWGVGVRLAMAGARQAMRPDFTAGAIFGITDPKALIVVQELGFANLSMGALGLVAGASAGFVVPAALAGGLFLGLAGIRHTLSPERNAKETIAMVSDLLMAALLAVFLALTFLG